MNRVASIWAHLRAGLRSLVVVGIVLFPALTVSALPTKLGDLDGDGQATVLDLVLLINHSRGVSLLDSAAAPYADINQDGFVDQADINLLAQAILGQYPLQPLAAKAVTLDPVSGSFEVGVTVRPKVTFRKPVNTSTLNSNNFYASFAGQKLPATITPANDGTFAWLFLSDALPNASQVMVTIGGATITNLDGTVLDAAGTGTPGSIVTVNFSTVSVAPVPGTVLAGKIVDPGPDLIPRTPDDISFGQGGITYNRPIVGAKIFVLGMETNFTFTGTNGSFFLTNMPVGDVKVVLDGRTAANPPAGYYFPEMVMDTAFLPGVTNGVMTIRDTNGVVVRGTNGAPIPVTAMYLPRVATNILQTVTSSTNTMITLKPQGAYTLPANQQPYLTIQIASNSLVGSNGLPVSSAQIGMSVVPPELVKDMLPPGLLQHTFDITVQAMGVATFSTPAKMTVPNVFNAAPGTKLDFLSFDHTTGRLVIEGTATVSDDGLYAATDPGTGITHPGWHGFSLEGALATLLVDIADKIPPECNPRKILEDVGGISLGLGGAIAAAAGAPFVAGAAAAGGLVFLGLDLYNEGITLQSANDAIGMASEYFGGLAAEIKLNLGGQVKLTRILTDPIFSDRFNQAFKRLAKKVGEVASSEGAQKLFAGIGSGLQGYDLGGQLANCIPFGGGFVAQPASEKISTPTALPTAAITGYLNQFETANIAAMEPVIEMIAAKLAPHLPTDRPIILVSDGHTLHGIELDASDYIDPLTSGALSIPISNLLADDLITNPFYRNRALTMSTNFNVVKSLLMENNPSLIAFRRQIDALTAAAHQRLRAILTFRSAAKPISYRVTDFRTGATVASGVSSTPSQIKFFGSAQTPFVVEVFDPATRTYGSQIFRSGASGRNFGNGFDGNTDLIALPDDPATSPDTDGDGLSDAVERLLGTDPNKWSTAGDGISDGAKVAQGLDPLSGAAFATGVIASLPLQGVAKEVVLSGSTATAGEQTAYVACGTGGLSIVNASKFQMPILLGKLSLPGDATDLAVDSSLQIAVVAANAGGLHFVNVANPMQPQLIRTIGISASQVEIVRGIAYVTVGTRVFSYEMVTGNLLQTLTLGGASLTGLSGEGLFLHTMDASRVLRAIDITDPLNMVARGSVTLPSGGGKLSVGGGVAFVAATSKLYGGFATVNVVDPDSLVLISDSMATSTSAAPNPNLAVNGSGLAILLANGNGIPPVAQVFNVSNPGNTGSFITAYPLPVAPYSVAIGSGVAFIADGSAGLQVVNYRPFDSQGMPPMISLSNSFAMLTTTNGTAEEGKTVRATAITIDDVQVRDVEFYIDGTLQLTDVSFPFDYRFVTPMRNGGKSNFTLQAKAVDTGGNVAWTPLITVALVPDATPPKVSRTFPIKGGFVGSSDNIAAYFNEPILSGTLTSTTILLKFLGADGIAGTPDDVTITNGVISYRDDLNAAFLRFPTNLGPGAYQATVGPPIADLAGNPMASAYTWQFYILGGQDTDQDGLPDVVEIALGLDPTKASTLNDGILDGDRDLNGDGLRASWKLRYGYDPLKRDSFNDGMFDKDRDPDLDTLTNLQEQNYGTHPYLADTDGDGWTDDSEIVAGSNPLDPLSRPKLFIAANPDIRVALPGLNVGGVHTLNTFVASPPISIALPGSGDPSGIPLNTVVAYPPIQISLTVLNGMSGPLLNTVVASPPVQVNLPGLGDAGGIPLNTVIAQPPVSVQILPGP